MRQYTIRDKKIFIKTNDLEVAIKRISKNKAIGTDNISLQPLDRNRTLKIKINNETYEEHKENCTYKVSKKDWKLMCYWKIS